ncbi:and other transporter-domain-containing protein [Naematelia encephala]|uniref:And other transporter-domain-containing protein n=1 Tax=Naematelia encephala TaxID=71784 RepID=A0A1Y2BLN1_9TREE|nr:and other transporter-domain-containing protein [Naematelia encephala]
MDRTPAPVILTEKKPHSTFPTGLDLADDDTSQATSYIDLRSRGMIKLYGIWGIAFLANFMAGFGVASLTAINVMSQYQDFFDFDGLGVSTGLVFSLWPIAACATFWLGPIFSDRFGRRGGMLISSLIFILGTVLVAYAHNVAMLLCGRFFLGAAVGMVQPAAGPYVTELSPPKIRGIVGGEPLTIFLEKLRIYIIQVWPTCVGSSVAFSPLAYVSAPLEFTVLGLGAPLGRYSSWLRKLLADFRTYSDLRLIVRCTLALSILFMPESPRWLYANGRPDEAEKVLIELHGDGEMTAFVKMEISQLKASLILVPRRWDYKVLVKDRAARYRTMLAVMMGAFGQLSGSGFSFFLPFLYRQVGVIGVRSQLIMTLAASLVSLLGAVIGSWQTDKLGRRKVLISGTFACGITLACAMGCSAASGVKTDGEAATNDVASKAAIAFLIIFGGVYAWCYQPLLGLYPTECLAMDQRSTGMGCMVLALNMCSFINQFAIPVAIKNIGWWTYLPYICWDMVETAAWYFLAVETKNRTLEELDAVFHAPNPVKASISTLPPETVPSENVASDATHTV